MKESPATLVSDVRQPPRNEPDGAFAPQQHLRHRLPLARRSPPDKQARIDALRADCTTVHKTATSAPTAGSAAPTTRAAKDWEHLRARYAALRYWESQQSACRRLHRDPYVPSLHTLGLRLCAPTPPHYPPPHQLHRPRETPTTCEYGGLTPPHTRRALARAWRCRSSTPSASASSDGLYTGGRSR